MTITYELTTYTKQKAKPYTQRLTNTQASNIIKTVWDATGPATFNRLFLDDAPVGWEIHHRGIRQTLIRIVD